MAEAVVFIPLTQGKVAVVDFDDYDLVRGFTWHAHKGVPNQPRWYAARKVSRNYKSKYIFIHRVVLGLKGIERGDHINGDSLDNRRCNLRMATHAENLRGFRRKPLGKSSRFRGVCFSIGRNKKWRAKISVPSVRGKGKPVYLGGFETEEDAARAYDAAAIRYGFPKEALNFK